MTCITLNMQYMSPLEKVPFATFYPLLKYLRGTCFFKNDFFKWTHILMFKGASMYSILSVDATCFFNIT